LKACSDGGSGSSRIKGGGGRTVTVVVFLEYAGHDLGITHSEIQKKKAGHEN
jgi:hypothetical protein